MSWIKSYQEIERHPKTMRMMALMGWDLDTAIAKLHRLWWWCADYAPDGRIDKYLPEQIAGACGVKEAKKFLDALCTAGFVDRKPYLRLHDWWDYFGEFLRGKYRAKPEEWQRVLREYSVSTPCKLPANSVPERIRKREREILSHARGREGGGFEAFWAAYPKQRGEDAARKAWDRKQPPLDKCLVALAWQKKTEQWQKEGRQFIPRAVNWINDGAWKDVPDDYKEVRCSVCGTKGVLPKTAQGDPICRSCKGKKEAVNA